MNLVVYLYLDESGDMGFNFFDNYSSKYFVVTILVVPGAENNKRLSKIGKMVLKRKSTKKKMLHELKGSATPTNIKKYYYEKIKKLNFSIYTVILDKQQCSEGIFYDKERMYSYISYQVLKQIPIDEDISSIYFVIDRSKSKKNIREFDNYIVRQTKGMINPQALFSIFHKNSKESFCLQAVDLFSWGIFRKYEHNDLTWYNEFQDKIKVEVLLVLDNKKERASKD